MSNSTATATVEKRGRKFQVVVDGKDVGKATTKKAAETERDRLNGVTKPEAAAPTQVVVDDTVVAETRHIDATPAAETPGDSPETPEPGTPAEPEAAVVETPEDKAAKRLDGMDAKAAEAEIKSWQDLLGTAREKGKGPAIAALEAMIAYGDKYMSTLEETGKPPTAKERAAQARADKLAMAEAAKGTESETDGDGRTQSGRKQPRPSVISKDGEMKCVGLKGKEDSPGCQKTLPVTSFPTKNMEERATECRSCRKERLAKKKA